MEENRIVKYFECYCRDYNHPLKLVYYPKGDIVKDNEYSEMLLMFSCKVYQSFWKRIKESFKYIFKKHSFDFENFLIMERKQIDELREFLDQFDREQK